MHGYSKPVLKALFGRSTTFENRSLNGSSQIRFVAYLTLVIVITTMCSALETFEGALIVITIGFEFSGLG